MRIPLQHFRKKLHNHTAGSCMVMPQNSTVLLTYVAYYLPDQLSRALFQDSPNAWDPNLHQCNSITDGSFMLLASAPRENPTIYTPTLIRSPAHTDSYSRVNALLQQLGPARLLFALQSNILVMISVQGVLTEMRFAGRWKIESNTACHATHAH